MATATAIDDSAVDTAQAIADQAKARKQRIMALTISLYLLPSLPETFTIEQKQGLYLYLLTTKNPNGFIRDLQCKLPFSPNLSPKQLSTIARIMVETFKKVLKDTNQIVQYDAAGNPVIVKDVELPAAPIPSTAPATDPYAGVRERRTVLDPEKYIGTYAVLLDGEQDQVTIRIKAVEGKSYKNKPALAIISYLAGPDNESDYQGFGWVLADGTYAIFQRFDQQGRLAQAADVLLSADADVKKALGNAYAKRSGNCYICGRKLTRVSSIDEGLGPICASKSEAA